MSSMSHQSAIPNPQSEMPRPLPGHIQTFYVKHQGRRLGPYYVRVWQQSGRRRKQYVPAHLVERVAQACQAHREMRARRKERRLELERILSNLSFLKRCASKANTIEELVPAEREHVLRIREQGVAAHGRPRLMRARRFMGHLVRKANLNAPNQSPPPPAGEVGEAGWGRTPEPLNEVPKAQSQEPESPPRRKVMRSWTLQRPVPEWLTEEKLDQMMEMLPKEKDE